MKILMLTPYLPFPPSSGGQVRSYNLIKNLAKEHEITLFSLIKNNEEKKYVRELGKYCAKVRVFNRPPNPWSLKNILRTGFSLYPFLVIRNLSGEEKIAVREELTSNKYDLIHAECFYVMPHIPETKTPILLVDQTIEFQVYQHFVATMRNSIWKMFLIPILYIDVWKIKYWELKFWRKARVVVAVSEADKSKMKKLAPGLNVDVVPNGAGEELMAVWGKRQPTNKPTIFFQANFDWLQNIEAAQNLIQKVFPLVRQEIRDSQCWIVGQKAATKIGNLKKEGVEIIDLETSDTKGVVDAYRKATIFVAPLEGPGGTRLKILAAMAAGVPVVTTEVGIEGIDARNGREVVIANTPTEMAKKVVSLLENRKLYINIAAAARKLVEEKYSYKNIANILSRIYRKVGNERG